MPVQTQWFRDRLAERRMSQRALARAMGLDSAAVSLMLRGRREMKISEAVEIAQLLGRPADEIMEAAGVAVSSQGRKVQVCGYIDGTGEVHAIHGRDLSTVPHPGGDVPPEARAYQCRTTGTGLDYMDGWILFTSAYVQPGVPAEAIGRLSLCQITGGICYLAKPTRGLNRGRWHLNGPAATAQNAALDWALPAILIQT